MIAVPDVEVETDREDHCQEPHKPLAYRGLGEGVYRTHNAATGQKGSQNREHERGEDEPDIPRFQHAPFLLHHHRMQERRSGEPREERRVFNRIPSPIAAPAKYRVRPVSTEKNPAGQKAPGNHGPTTRNVDPFLTWILHDEGAQRKSERHRKPHISQVQHRRMNNHLGILKERIESVSICWDVAAHKGKWRGSEVQQEDKEQLDGGKNRGGICCELYINLVPQTQHKPISTKQEGPEQQGTFLSRPERRELVRRRQVAVRVVQDIRNRKVIIKCRPNQCKGSSCDGCPSGDSSASGGFSECVVRSSNRLLSQGKNPSEEAVGTQ